MKNKVFNAGVFWEAFNQLKIVGFIATAVYLVAGIFIPIGYLIGGIADGYCEKFDVGYFAVLYALVYIFVPVMMMVIFFWLNKRHSCDFYHALPIKRESMYVNTILAVLLWVVVIFAAATVFPMCFAGISPKLSVNMEEFWQIIGYMFAGCIQMIGVFSIGIMITGNGFTNVIASLMVLAVPRGLLTGIIGMVSEFMPFVEINLSSSLLNPQYNICFGGFIYSLLWSSDAEISIMAPIIYSTLLGIIYMVFAGILFKRRKSESASQPSTNKVVQSICRMIPAYVFALLSLYFILYAVILEEPDSEYIFLATLFLIISILVYFIYELITTRRWRSVGKSAKQLPIFIGIVVFTGFSIWGGTTFALKRDISADEIKYIEVEHIDRLGELAKNDKVTIKDENTNQIIEKAYKRQLENYLEGRYYLCYEGEGITVGINQGGATFYRIVYLTEKEMDAFMDAYVDSLRDGEVKLELPKYSKIDYLYLSLDLLDESQLEDLYEVLREELKTVNYADLISPDYNEVAAYLSIENYDDLYDDYMYCSVPISDATPKTKAVLISMLYQNETKTDNRYIIDYLTGLDNYTDIEVNLDITIVSKDDIESYSIMIAPDETGTDEFVNVLRQISESTYGNNVVYISGYIYNYYEYDGYYGEWLDNLCSSIDDELTAVLLEAIESFIE